MDTRTGAIYPTREVALAAGVKDEDLVTGSPAALKKLRKRLISKGGPFGRFKNPKPSAADSTPKP